MKKVIKVISASFILFSLLFVKANQVDATGCRINPVFLNGNNQASNYSVLVAFDERMSGNVTIKAGSNFHGSYPLDDSDSIVLDFNVDHNLVNESDSWEVEVIGENTSCSTPYQAPSKPKPQPDDPTPNVDKGRITDDVSKSGPTSDDFNALNPLNQLSEGEAKSELFAGGKVTPANVIQRVLSFLFPLSGMILFVMIVWGGFEMLATSATKKSMDAGRQRITAAIAGFFLLFVSYWVMQILEVVLGIKVL